MKKKLSVIATLSLLFLDSACIPQETNTSETGDSNGGDKIVHVTGISLDKTTATIKEDESVTLTATVEPSDADNKTVTWSSSETTVAIVDNSGKVTGIKAGCATITVKTEDGDKTATCVITVEANLAPAVTVGADNISAISVVLKGKANLTNSVASDLQVGFQYSKSAGILPSNSISLQAEDADAEYNYTTSIKGLEPETTYYFRSFVRQNNVDSYGETKSFTTKNNASLLETLDASGVEPTCATLNAKLDLTDVLYKDLVYGFYWGRSEKEQYSWLNGGQLTDNTFSVTMSGLPHKTQYWYKAYVKLDDQTFYGETKAFTTDVIKVESVSLNSTEYTFPTIGSSLVLRATVLPEDATDRSVEWTSDNPDVAPVDQNGRVYAKDNGTATIMVTTKDQGLSASCTITVAQVISSINLDKTSLTLNEGEEYSLEATVYPSTAAEKAPKWTSSNQAVATVDDNGKVTAISKGLATIRAEAKDGSGKYATCSVSVIRLVSSIELNQTSLELYTDRSQQILATVIPKDANNTKITWASSDTTVATVSSYGVVKGVSPGNVTITAKANDASGIEASCSIQVKQSVTSIVLDNTYLSLVEGEDRLITATVEPDNAVNRSLKWTSSNETVAKVDDKGRVKALSKGYATITAAALDGSGKYATCRINVIRLVSSLELDKSYLLLGTDNTTTITAMILPVDASNTDLIWTSSNHRVARISNYGSYVKVTGESIGQATITAYTNDSSGKEASCLVEVVQSVTRITLDMTSLDFLPGDTWALTASVEPPEAYNKELEWSIDNTSVASVEGGLVRALAKGKATVTVSAADGSGATAHCAIVVSNPCPEGAVDLGLYSDDGYRLYWAQCNLCLNGFCDNPEDYGDYYAWGEIEPYYSSRNPVTWKNGKESGYNWTSYGGITKYNANDKKTVLDLIDDAACANLGGNWRLPTATEWKSLLASCSILSTEQNSRKGILVSAANGNSIFLPNGGYLEDTTRASGGLWYWSSSLDTESAGKWRDAQCFNNNHITIIDRPFGLSVRPVAE